MLIKVIYHDNRHDMVKPFILDSLIDSNKIKMFHRSDGWAIIGVSPLRKRQLQFHGKERRSSEGIHVSGRAESPVSPAITKSIAPLSEAQAKKLNCWEVMTCGREPGGRNVIEFGICPAATETKMNGVHGGKNAGRACWVVAGTMCHGKPQGTFSLKTRDCSRCLFYKSVKREEKNMIPTLFLLQMYQPDQTYQPEVVSK